MLKLPDVRTLFLSAGGTALKVSCGLLITVSAIAQPNRPQPRTPDPVYQVPVSATSQLPIHKPWTLLASKVAGNLNSTVSKQYLYVYQDRWYLSPPTKLSWSWDLGQEIPGTYKYFDGTTTGAIECRGSTEYPTFGIGCSEGVGNTRKVLPWTGAITATAKGTKSPSTGQGTVCQEASRAFGPGPCYQATIYVREVYDLLTDVVAPRLQPATTKSYLYLYQDRWYRSAGSTDRHRRRA